MLNLMEQYKRAEMRDENAYNCFISAFGQKFHDYDQFQLSVFCRILAQSGLS